MNYPSLLAIVLAFPVAACGEYRKAFGPHHRSPSAASPVDPLPPPLAPDKTADNSAFYAACAHQDTAEASRNLVKLVLAHPLIDTQDCLAASQKLATLPRISLLAAEPGLRVVSLAPLADAKELTTFGIGGVKLESLETLATLPKIAIIYLADITSLDLAPLKNSASLKRFKYDHFLTQRPDFASSDTMCPTGSNVNAEIDSYCRLYRLKLEDTFLGADSLLGTWADYTPERWFRLTIDENYNYTFAIGSSSAGKTEMHSEQGTVQATNLPSADDGYYEQMEFKPTSPECQTQSLTKFLSGGADGKIPYMRDFNGILRFKLKGPARLHMTRAAHLIPDGLKDLGCRF